jgi:hypothetical protein
MPTPHDIVDLTHQVRKLATGKFSDINDINRETTFLALNALIEAGRAGNAGKGFAVVANQVKQVAARIADITTSLNKELAGALSRLTDLGDKMIDQLRSHDGQRCADLAECAERCAGGDLRDGDEGRGRSRGSSAWRSCHFLRGGSIAAHRDLGGVRCAVNKRLNA